MYFRRQQWDIVGRFKLISAISYAIIIAGFIALIAHGGLKLGLSFTGGTDVSVRFSRPVAQPALIKALGELGIRDANVNTLNKPGEPVGERYTISSQKALSNNSDTLWKTLSALAPVDRAQSQVSSVGPALSREYLLKALYALLVAIAIQFIYIAFRFEWNIIFGLVTVIALVRDSAMMIGIYAIANRPADDAFLAAVLTVVGYSVMDTIVILDRIRENTRIMADRPYREIVNTSILQTMTRSLNTLATVVVTLVALLALGGVSLQNFAFALLVGICSGGYHSIFYSAPLVVRFREIQKRREVRAQARMLAEQKAGNAVALREREEVLAARKERREREKTQRPTSPARYKRRRPDAVDDELETPVLLGADIAAREAELDGDDDDDMLRHEEIVLNLDIDDEPDPADPARPRDDHERK